jgi:hypothetical protein
MVYVAPLVAGCILACKGWQSAGKRLEKNGTDIPMYLHYYTWFYLLLIGTFCIALQTAYTGVMSLSNWLDDDTTTEFAKSRFHAQNDMGNFTLWEKEGTLEGWVFLKYLSMLSPVFTLATLIVCIMHTVDHVKVMIKKKEEKGRKGLCDSPLHDGIIFILGLPAVYGIMSFMSVTRCWEITLNSVGGPCQPDHPNCQDATFESYQTRKGFLNEMYTTNFDVADVYETLALMAFGDLILQVLGGVMVEKNNEEDSNRGYHFKGKELTLFKSLRSVAVSGIFLFALSCALQAGYALLTTTCAFDFPSFFPGIFGEKGLLQQDAYKKMFKYFFYGFGFAGSYAAINNIFTIEIEFHEQLEEFKPFWKFWGTKILVTIAFFQDIILVVVPPFCSWEATYQNLLYASMLCAECLFIAVMHKFAWPLDEKWLVEGGEAVKQMEQSLLEADGLHPKSSLG